MTTKKVFISMPMNGKSSRQVREYRDKVFDLAKGLIPTSNGESIELIDSILENGPSSPVACLGQSIQLMDDADCMIMAPKWEKSRGCQIEWTVATSYGKEIIYINGGNNGRN